MTVRPDRRISVVCPVYDTRADWLRSAARSVLAEPPEVVGELILVDDGSTRPETLAALAALAAEPRVVCMKTPGNLGPGGARNRGIAAARFDWIGFLDSDDLWLAGRGEAIGAVLDTVPEAGWIAGGRRHLSPHGRIDDCPVLSEFAPVAQALAPHLARAEGLALTRFLVPTIRLFLGQVLVRRDLLGPDPPFPEKKMLGEDWLLFLLLSTRTPLVLVEAPFFVRRDDVPSITSSSLALREGDTAMLRLARRCPELKPLGRELRWAAYSARKRLAASHLLAGRRLSGLRHALLAWAIDPREIADLALFLKLGLRPGAADPSVAVARYSGGRPYRLIDSADKRPNGQPAA